LESSGEPFEKIISRIKTPGGTTEAALNAFEEGGVARGLIAGMHAAQKRGAELNSR
jgi:pyrroline-5-carboxylate reductase